MAEVLSQNEIDALLSALSSGDVESTDVKPKDEGKPKYKKYDFKSPQKFSKEHIRSLERVHDNFARIVSNYLSGQLRRNVKVDIQSVEQVQYEEFIRSIPNPTIISYFKMPPFQGNILLEINPQFSYKILEILLGGTGERKEVNKEFTDIEKNILSQVSIGMIKNLKLAWEEILQVWPEFEGIDTNPTANQTLAPNEPVALINFSVEIGKTNTYINLCIPYLSIEKIIDKLVIRYLFQNTSEEEEEKENKLRLKSKLNSVHLDVRMELGSTEITVNEFLELVCGDILKLDSKIENPMEVIVGDEPCYLVKPGIIGKKIGGEVVEIISKEVRINE